MSTDSTELTFVRCPSCRSLVPAVSTRCRMCGATLDASAKPEESGEDEKRSGRVRQHTMSQSHSELNAAAGQIRRESTASSSPDAATVNEPMSILEDESDMGDDGGVDNPLGEYMDEGDESAPQNGGAISTAPAAKIESIPEPEPFPVQPPPVEAPPKREEPRPRVTVESGARPSGKPSGLSFGKPKEQQAPPPPPAQQGSDRQANQSSGDVRRMPDRDRRPQENRSHEGDRDRRHQDARQQRHSNERQGGERQSNDRHSGGRQDQSGDRPPQPSRGGPGNSGEYRTRQPQQERQHQERQDRSHERDSGHVESTGVPGRLFGWLVSYETQEGQATEVREGKFFVSGSAIKKNDLVISNKGLSSPHALVSAIAGQGLKVQDLMSDSGLFVRKKNRDTFQREEGAVTLDHGDWVKFGEVEYLVVLVSLNR